MSCASSKTRCDLADPCGRCLKRSTPCIRCENSTAREVVEPLYAENEDVQERSVNPATLVFPPELDLQDSNSARVKYPAQSQSIPITSDHAASPRNPAPTNPNPFFISIVQQTETAGHLPTASNSKDCNTREEGCTPHVHKAMATSVPALGWQFVNEQYDIGDYANFLPYPTHDASGNPQPGANQIEQAAIPALVGLPLSGNGSTHATGMDASQCLWNAAISTPDTWLQNPVTTVTQDGGCVLGNDQVSAFDFRVEDLLLRYLTSDMSAPVNTEDSRSPGRLLAHWPICQCTPTPSTPTPTPGLLSSSKLRIDFEDPGPWSNSVENWRNEVFAHREHFANVALTESTREWMLLALQNFLHTGLDLFQSNDPVSSAGIGRRDPSVFLRLPPSNSLHRYLEIFLVGFEPFFPLIPAATLNPNSLVTKSNERGATLLMLLMVACGAMLDPAEKARDFAAALTEVCRLSLFGLLQGHLVVTQRAVSLHCGLLLTIGGAFSGCNWHMEIATGQRFSFISVRAELMSLISAIFVCNR